MASLGSSQLLDKLALGVEEVRWINYTLVPSITIMVFDWFLTVELEVSLVWSSPWNGVKAVFLLARYLPFVDMSVLTYYQLGFALPQHVCKLSYEYVSWTFVIGQGFAVLILTIRTWAICGKGKKSTYGLFGMFGMAWVASLILVGLYLRSSIFKASDIPKLIGCTFQAEGSYLASIYVILMFYDGSLLLLMIIQGISTFRTAGNLQLTRVIYRDGILYYVYIFGLSLVNTVIIFRLQEAYMTLLVPIERVAYSVLACRVILHIREQGQVEGLLPEQTTGSVRFAQITERSGHVPTDINLNEEVGGGV